jgi:hypothetical protein
MTTVQFLSLVKRCFHIMVLNKVTV